MQLGDQIRDKINGFTGVATGMTEYINGCRQFLLKPTGLKDGKPIEGQWIDEQHLEVVVAQVIANPFAKPSAPARAGGPDRSERAT